MYRTADLALSQNPLQWGAPAARDASARTDAMGRRVGSYKRDQYGRVIGGGGGGGGGQAPQFVAPAQPFSTPYGDILGSMGDASSWGDYAGAVLGGLGNFYAKK